MNAGDYIELVSSNPVLKWTKVPGEPEGTAEVVPHEHEDGSYTHLLRIEKGVVIPGVVVHDFYEEAYYLEGKILNTTTGQTISRGMYVYHAPGEEHGPFRCLETCLILEFRYYK